jgi:hypothetical protein
VIAAAVQRREPGASVEIAAADDRFDSQRLFYGVCKSRCQRLSVRSPMLEGIGLRGALQGSGTHYGRLSCRVNHGKSLAAAPATMYCGLRRKQPALGVASATRCRT